jgi:hypothetical protein
MLGGISVGFYTIVFATSLPFIGPFAGCAVSYLGALLCCSMPVMLILRKCGGRAVPKREEEQELVVRRCYIFGIMGQGGGTTNRCTFRGNCPRRGSELTSLINNYLFRKSLYKNATLLLR